MIPAEPLDVAEQPPLARLARSLDAPFRDGCVLFFDHLIYADLRSVWVAQMGQKIARLGFWNDPTENLATAYRDWASRQVTA